MKQETKWVLEDGIMKRLKVTTTIEEEIPVEVYNTQVAQLRTAIEEFDPIEIANAEKAKLENKLAELEEIQESMLSTG